MILTSFLQVFAVGLIGGCGLELIHWYNVRKDGKWPDYAYSAKYWILSGLMAVAGGGLAVLYFGSRAEGPIVLHVGLSAPLILQKFATTVAVRRGARSARPGILNFFDW
jgi:hypothetical protein